MEQRERRQLTAAGPYRRKSDMMAALEKLKTFPKEERALIIQKAGDLMGQDQRLEASAAIFQAIEITVDRRNNGKAA